MKRIREKAMNIVYHKIQGTTDAFLVERNGENAITGIRSPWDDCAMNWVTAEKIWGSVRCIYDMDVTVFREYTNRHTLKETFVFYNGTDFDIYTESTQMGICVPLPDYYTDAGICLTQCCHAHIWCGESSSYIMAVRMGGKAPHLGMVLRKGKLQGYSVEREEHAVGREEELSNRRGDFILHPENCHLRSREAYVLEWELFWFQNKEDFRCRLRSTENYIYAEAVSHVLFLGEELSFTASVNSENADERWMILVNGRETECGQKGNHVTCNRITEATGEYLYDICRGDRKTQILFLVTPPLRELAKKRCHFIADYQQCREESYLKGAYLIYDNEEKKQYYAHVNDHNGGRERVGMGVLMAYYLQCCPDEELEKSLDCYLQYVLRELFNETTGEVFNDAPRCRDYIRLYNYPWISRFFLELYQFKKEGLFLDRYYKSIEYFYQEGGSHFYAIGIPMYESVQIFRKAGRMQQAEKLLAYYEEHGNFILSCGRNYPAHEVDYEQSIVAPAAIYMCELFCLTGKEKYRKGAEQQLQILDLFQGFQPDYHMNEVAIRHWDGYWFGKRRCLGDTYPHYWSVLSGCAYALAGKIMDADLYRRKAENTLRAVLSLIREDGSASCAMVYPLRVNGKQAHFYDPWANDQDWGLYFALKYM